jgi:hypothetical protein
LQDGYIVTRQKIMQDLKTLKPNFVNMVEEQIVLMPIPLPSE